MLTYTQALVDGQVIGYATEGAGPPLLLLHGLGFDHRAWAAAAPFLAGHFRLIIPDLPGFGRSRTALWDGSPDSLNRLAAGLLTATQAVPAFVAGSGLGGTLALTLAARYPERVRAVIAIGAPGPQIWPATTQGRLIRAIRGIPGALDLGARFLANSQARWLLRDSFVTGTPLPDQIATVAQVLRDPVSRQVLVRALRRLDEWNLALRQLGGVRVPALLVWGELDALYGLLAAERLRQTIPGAQLISIAGAGHALAAERPADLAALIRRFLAPAQRR
jgi:pimeloyl-ACP methyl ester carboxylesterase